jgi:two-component sensor histidine kinase
MSLRSHRARHAARDGEPTAWAAPGEGAPPAGAEQAAYWHAFKRVRALRGFYKHLAVYLVVNTVLIVVNLLSPSGRPWSLWPLAGWGFAVLVHGLTVWGGTFWLGREWEQRKIAELLSRERIRSLSTEKQVAQAQLRMLQAQIEPHFLFNTLANVVSLIEPAPVRASAMLEHFIAYLRASLASSRADQGTVGQEAALLRNYLELLQIRMGERLAFAIEVEPGLEDAPLAPMLLQPVVENAIKHGLEPKIEGGRVDVRIRREGTRGRARMVARVEDDGLGFKPGEGSGIGLQNLRERLGVLYDGDAHLSIEERAGGGTVVVVDLPLRNA